MPSATIIFFCFVMTASANILMPHSFFSTRSDTLVGPSYQDEIVEDTNEKVPVTNAFQQQHNRNCFFTPVQCMLPLSASHKDVQSLHGVYSPSATHVRRSVDSIPVLTSPWGYTDLIKRGGDNRFYQWLSRF